jgi:hypothetical protein
MLSTLTGLGTVSVPAPAALKVAPSPEALFHAPEFQFRLEVSQRTLPEPLIQMTSPARAIGASVAKTASVSPAATERGPRKERKADMGLSSPGRAPAR